MIWSKTYFMPPMTTTTIIELVPGTPADPGPHRRLVWSTGAAVLRLHLRRSRPLRPLRRPLVADARFVFRPHRSHRRRPRRRGRRPRDRLRRGTQLPDARQSHVGRGGAPRGRVGRPPPRSPRVFERADEGELSESLRARLGVLRAGARGHAGAPGHGRRRAPARQRPGARPARGCHALHLDVLSDNRRSRFYRAHGLVTMAETIAPEPCRQHGVPMEMRMVAPLQEETHEAHRLAVSGHGAAAARSRPADLERFVAAPRIAMLSYVKRDGTPAQAPIWYQYRDGRFAMVTSKTSPKAKALARAKRACLTIQDEMPPYRAVIVDGDGHAHRRRGRGRHQQLARHALLRPARRARVREDDGRGEPQDRPQPDHLRSRARARLRQPPPGRRARLRLYMRLRESLPIPRSWL